MTRGKVLRIRKDVPATWEEALQQYLYFKQAGGLRPATVEGHRREVGIFFRRFPQVWGEGKAFKKAVYTHFAQDVKPATYNIRLAYLSNFFKWCVKEGIFPENPLAGLKKRKDEGRVVNLDATTLTKLITLPDKNTFSGLRDYALILLTLDTGIRPKEAFSLLPGDVNLRSLEVYVRSDVSKTKVSRTLPISPVTAEAIHSLLNVRHPAWKDTVPVFCTQDGKPLNRGSWNDRLEVYSQRLGVKVRPYDLRHAFALTFLRNGGHALALQRTLGHTDLSMTKRYVALTEQDLREQHTLASPLNVLLPKKSRVRKVKLED